MIIYQHSLHFEVCLLAILLIFKLDECILKAVTGTLITNNFTRYYSTKTAEYGVEILICREI